MPTVRPAVQRLCVLTFGALSRPGLAMLRRKDHCSGAHLTRVVSRVTVGTRPLRKTARLKGGRGLGCLCLVVRYPLAHAACQ